MPLTQVSYLEIFKCHVPISTGQKLSGQCESNELYSIMLQAHLEDGDKKFIRDVKAYPKPAIFLASEQQLLEIERFCCDSTDFSIMTVDPTFSLGDFDVTPTTFHHLMLGSKRTRKPPVHVRTNHDSLQKNVQYVQVSCILYDWSLP